MKNVLWPSVAMSRGEKTAFGIINQVQVAEHGNTPLILALHNEPDLVVPFTAVAE